MQALFKGEVVNIVKSIGNSSLTQIEQNDELFWVKTSHIKPLSDIPNGEFAASLPLPKPIAKKKKEPYKFPDLAKFVFTSSFVFPDENKILSMVKELRAARTTATKVKSPLGYLLRPSAFHMPDSAEAAEVDAHKIVEECVRQIGGEPVEIDAQNGFPATHVNVFFNKKIVLWLRTSQPNSVQNKDWPNLRDVVLKQLFDGFEILTTTHGDTPVKTKKAKALLTDNAVSVWEKLTGNATAYKRIEELLRLEAGAFAASAAS